MWATPVQFKTSHVLGQGGAGTGTACCKLLLEASPKQGVQLLTVSSELGPEYSAEGCRLAK